MLAKTFRGEWRHGALVPLQPLRVREGTVLWVTIEDPREVGKWSKELYDLFAPAADELADVPTTTIHRLVTEVVETIQENHPVIDQTE